MQSIHEQDTSHGCSGHQPGNAVTGTPEDAKQIYRKDATSTGIYDRVRANLPADKMRAFNLLVRNAAKLGGKLSKLAEMCPDRVQVRKEGGGRRNVYTIAHSVTG